MVLQENTKFIICKNIFSEYIDSSCFVLNINDGEYYEFIETAYDLWKFIDSNEIVELRIILEKMGSNFDTLQKDIIKDIYEFLEELIKLNLIKII